ncbi:MAG: vitamin K epoxide reductase family protein [Planctomycetaceae bacterium]
MDETDAGKHESHKMAMRGVARPMEMMDYGDQSGHSDQGEHSDGHAAHCGKVESQHEMSHEHRLKMLRQHHQKTLWIYWTLVVLGLWTAVAPMTFGYLNPDIWVDPAGGRGVWFSDQTHTRLRAILMTVSDVASGIALTLFGWRTLTPNRPKSLWACCGIGLWLTMAPVLLWAPVGSSYVNDTVVGALVIALSILIPGMPGMMMFMQHGPPVPPGWSYNPSSWAQRWIMIVTGFAGWIVSRYLAAFQLGYITAVADPVFGFAEGTKQVLNSNMSHLWPISDGGLGAISYTFEFLMGYMGSPARWRTMPWMVAFFGILVIPLGLTHIILVMSQPMVVHHWCLMCLLAAGIMLPMIPLEVDEVVAMGQHMVEAGRRGDRGGSMWKIFWLGGSAEGCTHDDDSPPLVDLPSRPGPVFLASIRGMTFPWTLTASAVLGIALMFCPTIFRIDIQERAADVGHVGGALIVTVAVVCMGEVIRLGRYLNVVFGAAVAIFPLLITATPTGYAVTCAVLGAMVIVLSIPCGIKRERYGLWDRYVR